MAIVYYTAVIEGGKKPGYSVFFSNLDGCASAGDTIEATVRNAEEALSLHVSGMLQEGLAMPDPRPPESIPFDPEIQEIVRMLVRADLPGKAVRVNISIDEGTLAMLDNAARVRSMSRSGLLSVAFRQYVNPRISGER